MSQEILPGCPVTLHLSIALEDGTEAVSTFGEDPIELQMGDGTLQPGLELAIYGLKTGDTQTLSLLPDQAYGPRDPGLIQYMPMSDFNGEFSPEVGQIIAFALPNEEEAAGMVLGIEDGQVEVDFNHPLAGRTILFDVLVHRVEAAELH